MTTTPRPDRALPDGAVTFALGDIEGSSRLWEDHTVAMPAVIARLGAIVDRAVSAHDGRRPLEQGEGDSFVAAFDRPTDAIAFALDLQQAIASETWDNGVVLSVRIGVHTGEAHRAGDAYLGESLNRCGRIRAIGHGGQVLVSGTTAELVQDQLPDGASLRGLGVHRLRDLTRPERVHQLCHPLLADGFAPLRSVDQLPNNLPLQLTSFVGRESALVELAELIRENRMSTLTGAGGSGKTRLALQLAFEQRDSFPGGVWLVDLAPLADPALVPYAIASAVGVAEVHHQSILQTLEEHLRGERVLVILDNCEHLVDATGECADRLLRACPDVVVVATSREPLGIEGEATYRVPSLSLPSGDDDGNAEAVRLFAERAQLARATFRLDPSTLPSVVAICRRLDGVALAIELAAARVRSLSPVQIAEQVSQRFALLTTGRRGALPRQRTLEASVDWSHSLLSDDERVLFRRLSVFSGGFTLDAAEVVCRGDGLDGWQVLDVLSGLVDKSLVQFDDGFGPDRYRMLETIRFYARQRLIDSGEIESVRDRHLDWCLLIAEDGATRLFGPDMAAVLDGIEAELDNHRAALDWAEEQRRGDVLQRMGAALGMFWLLRRSAEGYPRLNTALEMGGQVDEDAWVQTVSYQVHIGFYMGDLPKMIRLAEEMLDLGRRAGNALAIGRGLDLLGWDSVFGSSHRAGAVALFEECLPYLEEAGDFWYQVDAFCGLSMIALAVGDTEAAARAAARALVTARPTGNSMLIGWALTLSAAVAQRRGELDEAEATFAEAAKAIAVIGGDDFFTGWTASGPIMVLNARGRFAEALALADRNLDVTCGQHNVFGIATTLWTRAIVEHRSGEPGGSIPSADRCEAMMAAAGVVAPVLWIRALRAEQALGRGDTVHARQSADEAVALGRSDPSGHEGMQRALLASARISRCELACTEAQDVAHEVLGNAHRGVTRLVVPECIELLAGLAADLESFAEAARLLGAASALRDGLGYPLPPVETPDHDAAMRAARDGLGDAAFEVAFAEGLAMDLDGAVAYAQRDRGERTRPSSG